MAIRDRRRLAISPTLYSRVALVALAALVMIVFTGSAVRLTASGLGCPDWPRCYGQTVPPLQINAVIEYGNRIFTGFVGIAVIAASLLAFFRRPFRWHLALFGALLPLGVIAQAGLGALVVKHHLPPELVLGHFILSMILIDAAFALAWCSRYEPGERRRSRDRLGVWAVRCLVPIGQLTILLGTITTGSGPHAGDHDGELVRRFDFKGSETLEWMVQRHAAAAILFGISVLAVYLLLTRRAKGDDRAALPLLVVFGMLLAQIGVGILQWQLHLPAGIVWVHVCLATLTWIAMLWAVAKAGQIEGPGPRSSAAPAG